MDITYNICSVDKRKTMINNNSTIFNIAGSFYAVECFAETEALQSIFSLLTDKFLIEADYLSCLQAVFTDIF